MLYVTEIQDDNPIQATKDLFSTENEQEVFEMLEKYKKEGKNVIVTEDF